MPVGREGGGGWSPISSAAFVGRSDGILTDFLFLSIVRFSVDLPHPLLFRPVEPKVSQCACQIHTQQGIYLESLGWLMASVHADCDCTCSWCDGMGCQKWKEMCKGLHQFSEALCCEKVDLLEGDPEGGFEYFGRKPACTAGKCADCGFGGPNGIPTDCKAFEKHWG